MTISQRPEPVRIGQRAVGPGEPAYIVAELSANHGGSLDRALETVRAAADAGADAIKLQTYTPDTMTIESSAPSFVVGGTGPWAGRTLYDLYREAHTPWEWHKALFEEAGKCGIDIFSTPFDDSAVEFLQELGAVAFKIASFELTDDALVKTIGATGKPVIASTGMASLEEIAHAQSVLRAAGCTGMIFLKCTSSYPAPDDAMNLSALAALETVTRCPVGLSDHSNGVVAPIVAVSLGACFIEKHFTLSRADGGVDSHFSLEPSEFRQLVDEVRRAEAMVGRPVFGSGSADEGSLIFRRSLYVVEDVAAGETLTSKNVRSIRPGDGLAPRYLEIVLGRHATAPISRGTPLRWEHILV